ncbi:hypothetical protein ACCAA_10047 [Candidatus Accumulibacter aalborgensis]|uniref:Uncharacterized protein n=1 Tax=Candidatus Accumulibacter aalborgensis TaxID=1860102 RepID=A0A1A8XD04_9PROT|nr:hypothetical protein ACCAA_10047 [Candidatus Accumulibacter aalborgensis]
MSGRPPRVTDSGAHMIYPAVLTRRIQLGLAAAVMLINLAVYGWLADRLRQRDCARN